MASSDDEHKPASVYLVIAIILAVLIFLNILLGIVYLLIPKECFDCQGAAYRRRVAAAAAAEDGGGFYHRARRGAHGYEVARSIYISGSQGQQVTIINGIVEVDDEIDAWAYWATDSEETLRGIPLNTAQPQYQRQSRYGMQNNDAAIAARTTPTATAMVSDYDYHHSYEQDAPEMQLTSDGIVTMMPNQGDLVLGLAGYDALSPMEAVPERAVTRPPLARSIDVYPPPPQTPSTVRTWGRDSDATIRPVVESPRREIGEARDKRYSRQVQGEDCL